MEGEGPIADAPGVVAAEQANGRWRLTLAAELDAPRFLPTLVARPGVRISHYEAALPSLSDIFIRVVGPEEPGE